MDSLILRTAGTKQDGDTAVQHVKINSISVQYNTIQQSLDQALPYRKHHYESARTAPMPQVRRNSKKTEQKTIVYRQII